MDPWTRPMGPTMASGPCPMAPGPWPWPRARVLALALGQGQATILGPMGLAHGPMGKSICLSICIHIYIYIYICEPVHRHARCRVEQQWVKPRTVHIFIHTFPYIYIYIYPHMYTCINTYIYIYIDIYTCPYWSLWILEGPIDPYRFRIDPRTFCIGWMLIATLFQLFFEEETRWTYVGLCVVLVSSIQDPYDLMVCFKQMCISYARTGGDP